MKKIYYYIVLLFTSFSNAQYLNEGFENGIPPTWAVFETGTGITYNWTSIPYSQTAAFVCHGSQAAYLMRENVLTGTAIDWLVTPSVTVPANGKLKFSTKTIQAGVQGSLFSVRVSTTSQTDANSFTTIVSWDEASLTTTYNVCEEKTVDLTGFAPGQNIYIAFVMENDNGDRWILDDVRMSENLIKPIAFLDSNSNGIKDANELNFKNGDFQVAINNGSIINYSGEHGNLSLYPQNSTDLYDISFAVHPEYSSFYSPIVNYNDITSASLGANTNLYFPISVANPFSEVGIQIHSNWTPRPGYNYYNTITYRNNGSLVENGQIQFTKPANLTITDLFAINASAVQNVTGFTYNYTNLQPQEVRKIYVQMSVPTIPTVQIGDIVTSNVMINTTNSDIILSNNSATLNKTIVAAFDPNDKHENHGPTIVKDNFTNEDYLVYTIRFQNTGTAPTSTIRVEDFLDAKLNPATVRMIDASHNYVLSMQNNHLVWKFDPIFLTPMSVDEDNSHGYITFKVKPFQGYQVGDIIPNTASIYFDTNPAIVTNTFQTEFTTVLSNESFNLEAITIYPNPSNDIVNIQVGKNENKMKSIEIADILGKKVFESKFENKINISNLNQGVYFITLISNENEKFTKKIIKE